MSVQTLIVETTQPSYEIIKWIGGGGFGQVFKVSRKGRIVACKQVRTNDLNFALAEHKHMNLVKGGPHIVSVHDDVEYDPRTNTLSFFMDYHEGKDLDRVVHVLRASGQRFTENQILDMAYQMTVALEFCHSMNLLHQDLKPMNVLLGTRWNPLTDTTVPDLYVTDFGIASRVQTLGTRISAQRGTPSYEAPEIRDMGQHAQFSQKSDIYSLGCILYRLCTLEDPYDVSGTEARDMNQYYSIDIRTLVCSMIGIDRRDRPTATQVREALMAIMRRVNPTAEECRECRRAFLSSTKLQHHQRQPGGCRGGAIQNHIKEEGRESVDPSMRSPETWFDDTAGFTIKGRAQATKRAKSQEKGSQFTPCVVCMGHFDSKQDFFKHLHNKRHWRSRKFVSKRVLGER